MASDHRAGSVYADPQRVRQIVWNLVANAIKFTPRGGHVQVVLQRVDSRVRLAVSDDGEGIDPADVPFLFERFWRSDRPRRPRRRGWASASRSRAAWSSCTAAR